MFSASRGRLFAFLREVYSKRLFISSSKFAKCDRSYNIFIAHHAVRDGRLISPLASTTNFTSVDNLLTNIRHAHDFSKDKEMKNILQQIQSDMAHSKNEEEIIDTMTNEKQISATCETSQVADEEEYEDFVISDNTVHEEVIDIIHPISLERGTHGVFDVEEVVEVLRSENGIDVCTIKVPEHINYVDYLVIVTGRSHRHLVAMAEYMKKLFKLKRSADDAESVDIEGKQTKDWLAMDLGNVAVHLFLAETRAVYDIESLWTLGEGFDENLADIEQSDPYSFLFEERTKLDSQNELEIETESDIKDEEVADGSRIESFASHSDIWHGTGS